ncbi:hypothetical protein ANN_02623 [Periplaneta americana]|uniref:Uncharacterized protein n=1 Tax=Periplaneta americana TaxID=6978 RepID=A0ABQ8TWT4_PERAM|nr:hypothetical protein ANN_02623 [Periplaneta americana]
MLHSATYVKAFLTADWMTKASQPNNRSTRRVDILAYNADTKQGIIVDPTIRFKVECHQSAEVHYEKKSIYEPTVNYFKRKYALIHVETSHRCLIDLRTRSQTSGVLRMSSEHATIRFRRDSKSGTGDE